MIRQLTWMILLATSLVAQDGQEAQEAGGAAAPATDPGLELTLRERGQGLWEVTATAEQASLREILVSVAGQLSRELLMDEGVLDLLSETSVPLNIKATPLEEFVSLVATIVGLDGTVEEGGIRLRHRKPEGTEDAGDEARRLAGDAYQRSGVQNLADADAGLLYRVAILFFSAEDYSRALRMFKSFLARHENDPRASRVRLLGGHAALKLGRNAEARRLLVEIEDTDPNSSEILPATLLLSRVFMAENKPAEAVVRLRRVIDETRDPEEKSTALLLRTQMWFDLGEWNEALESIEEYDLDLDRSVDSRTSKVALARGLCRQRAGKIERSFTPLQYAWLRLEDAPQRLEVAVAMAEAWSQYGEHFLALQALREADALELESWQKLRLLQARARVLEQFSLLSRLEKTYREMAELELMEHPKDRERTLWAIEGLADLLFEQQRFEDARGIFAELQQLPELRARALFMLARCAKASGNYQETLELLTMVPVDGARVTVDEIVRLRGDTLLALGRPLEAAQAFEGQTVRKGN